MNRRRSRITCLLAGVSATASVLAIPAHAQFDEPDTRPRLGIGAFAEATFRGSRGKVADDDLSFDNGPALGLTLGYRVGRALSLDVSGSWARSEERLQSGQGGVDALKFGDMTLWQLWGELVFRLKPSVPGYFLLGGGARRVVPDKVDPDDLTTARFTREDSYTEPIVSLGAGLEFRAGEHGAVRAYLRIYTGPPADLGGRTSETNSLATDFALGAALFYRM